MKHYLYRTICIILSAVLAAAGLSLPASAATIISNDSTTIYVEEMDSHSEGVVPSRGMAIRNGQWFEYNIESPVEGDFRFILYFSYRTTWSMKITLNDEVAYSGNFTDQSGGNSDIFSSELCTLHLKQGMNKLRIERISHDYHISHFVLQSVTSLYGDKPRTEGEYRASYLPCKIEAENFDYGTEGSGINELQELSNKYRDTNVPISENGENYTITLDKQDWTRYTFHCEYSGVYALAASTNSYGSAEIYIDDKLTDIFSAPGTSGYEEASVCNIYIPKGTHTLTVKSVDRKLSFDYFRFSSVKTEDYVEIGGAKTEGKTDEAGSSTAAARDVYMSLYVAKNGSDSNDGTKDSPFATIERALEEVEKNRENMTGDIVVNISSGVYKLSETLRIDERYSGRDGNYVVFRGIGEEKPILSGGIEVTGWEKENEYVYKASVPEAENVREFYVNGYAAQRARSKYAYSPDESYVREGSANTSDGFYVSRKNFPQEFKHPEELELSWTNEWVNQRTPVDSIAADGDRFIFNMRQPVWEIATTKPFSTTRAGIGTFYVENAYELLDEPGEFYFDKTEKLLYYYPYKAEDLENSECYAGAVELLLKIEGESNANKARFISFENIDFRHGTWFYASEKGLVSGQAGSCYDIDSGGAEDFLMPGQVSVNHAEFVNILDCSFINLGTSALTMTDGAANINVEGNLFRDIMGGAVEIDSNKHGAVMPENEERVKNVTVKNNLIIRVAQGYYGLCGITAFYPDTVNIESNELYDLPYTGISVGWGWGADVPGMRNITVIDNVVKNSVYLMHDGAPIYTLGPIRGGVVKGNYLSLSPRAHSSIYHDNGSRYIETYDNVTEDSGEYNRYLYINTNSSTLNIHDNFATETNWTNLGGSSTVADAVKLIKGAYPERAKEIINNAGLDYEYAHLRENTELPDYRSNVAAVKTVFTSKDAVEVWTADYIRGGAGVAYYDTTDGNAGKAYRQDDVDIWGSSSFSGRYDVGIDAGEWINYDVKIPETATYNLVMWASNSKTDKAPMPSFNMYCDDELITSKQPIGFTGATNKYAYNTIRNISLSEGKHRIKLEGLNDFFGVTFFRFEKVKDGYLDIDFDEGVYEKEKEKIIFNDMTGHWAESTVYTAAEDGLIYGMGDNMFAPDSNITLSQTVMLLLRLGDLYDTSLTWQENAYNRRLSDAQEQTDRVITREEFISLMMKRYTSDNGNYQIVYDMNKFTDLSEARTENAAPILGAAELGIIGGYPDGSIRPTAELSRAEAAVMLLKLRDVL